MMRETRRLTWILMLALIMTEKVSEWEAKRNFHSRIMSYSVSDLGSLNEACVKEIEITREYKFNCKLYDSDACYKLFPCGDETGQVFVQTSDWHSFLTRGFKPPPHYTTSGWRRSLSCFVAMKESLTLKPCPLLRKQLHTYINYHS